MSIEESVAADDRHVRHLLTPEHVVRGQREKVELLWEQKKEVMDHMFGCQSLRTLGPVLYLSIIGSPNVGIPPRGIRVEEGK